jgi:DNA-binding NtrC family response regulator
MEDIAKRILIVDDDPNCLSCTQEALQDAGYRVVVKTDAKAALSYFDGPDGADLVISDYRMPGMDGLEFMAALRKMKPSIPVILMTAGGSIDTYIKAQRLGAYEYVNKPVSLLELKTIVKFALDRSPQSPIETLTNSD